jgi:type II secretory pathway pseudopilin PulG
LVEALLALALAAVIATALGGALSRGVALVRRIDAQRSLNDAARLTLEGVARELRNAVDVPGRPFRGAADALRFNAAAVRWPIDGGPPAPVVDAVSYRAVEGRVRRGRRRWPGREDADDEILEGTLTFAYAPALTRSTAWVDDWTADALPAAVLVTATARGAEGRTAVFTRLCPVAAVAP